MCFAASTCPGQCLTEPANAEQMGAQGRTRDQKLLSVARNFIRSIA